MSRPATLQQRSRAWNGFALGTLASSLLWIMQPVAIGVAAASVPPLLQASMASTSALFLVWLWTRWRNVPVFAQDDSLAPGAALGLLFSARLGLMYLALVRLPVPQAVALVFAALVTMQLLAASVRAAWPQQTLLRPNSTPRSLRLLAGLVLASASAWLATRAALPAAAGAALLAGLLWAAEARIARGPRLAHCGGEKILFYQLIGAAVVLPVASVATSESWLAHPGALGWAALGVQALLGGLALPLLWFAPDAIQRPRPLATLVMLAPLGTALLVWFCNAAIQPGLLASPSGDTLAACLVLTAAAWLTTRRE
jgi:drug/metabolite transporter (DMT)-like permease